MNSLEPDGRTEARAARLAPLAQMDLRPISVLLAFSWINLHPAAGDSRRQSDDGARRSRGAPLRRRAAAPDVGKEPDPCLRWSVRWSWPGRLCDPAAVRTADPWIVSALLRAICIQITASLYIQYLKS